MFSPVSIIICAKNESQNLTERLPAILQQDYPEFEVIVVNDRSTDNTAKVLSKLSHKFSNLRIITVEDINSKAKGKKNALAKGIEHAVFTDLLLTDADCIPSSKQWIKHMVSARNNSHEIVLGYGPHEKKDGFLNKFIRYETATTALQYFSFALWGVPYMGVGRNLAYSKKTYIDNQGFASHKHIASGDDDLFISEVATGENTQICLNPSSFMYSKPESNIKNYHVKKTRHFSTGKHYKRHIVLLLSLFSASQIVFYASIVALLKFDIEVSTVMILFIFRMLLILLVFGKILKKLREPDLIPFIPLFDILYVVYYVLFIPAVMLNNTTKQWK